MKNRTLILGIVAAVLFVSLIIAFIFSINSEKKDASFIPDSALLIWESKQPAYSAEKAKDFSFIKNISQLDFYESLRQDISLFSSITAEAEIDELFDNASFRVSLHPISINTFDLIFYIPLKKPALGFLQTLENSDKLKISKREYQNEEIIDIKIKEGKSYTFCLKKGYLITSQTPFLIEDVIRQSELEGGANFYSEFKKRFSKNMVQNDDGELYVNSNKFSELIKLFIKNENHAALENLNSFFPNTYYDINIKDNYLLLSGASEYGMELKSYLDIFQNEAPQSFEIKQLIPSNTSLLLFSGFESGTKLLPKLKTYFTKTGQGKNIENWKSIAQENKVYLDKFFELIESEIALCLLESNNPSNPDKLLFIKTNNRENAQAYLKEISDNFFTGEEESAFFEEYYRGKLIREISKENLPEILFGNHYKGFNDCFFFMIDDYVVLSNSINSARKLIDDIDDEKVWGKTVKQNLFLEQCISETNVSVILNVARNWEYLNYNVNDFWSEFSSDYSNNIKQFEQMAFQFSSLEDRFYAGAVIKHKEFESEILKSKKKNTNTLWTFKNDFPFISKAKVVRNHNDNSFECLVQDEELNLHLISKKGQRLWTVKLLDQIIENGIHQIDFYKNGKLQYAICGEKYVYLIDRNGNTVESYPQKFTKEDNQDLKFFRVLDYDNSKKYRFLFSDNKGSVFMTDKELKVLDGWNPLEQKSSNTASPLHYRIAGKDFIVLLQKAGTLDIKKRNSNSYSNFPINLYNRINTNYFVQVDKDFESSQIHILDEEGMLKKIDLKGKISSESQFFKPDKTSQFELVLDGLGQTYIIARKDPGVINLLDRKEKNLAELSIKSKNETRTQFYNFGADNELYIITDQDNKVSHIFNSNGEIDFSEPVKSSNDLSILYYDSEEFYKVYKVFDNELSLFTFEN